MFQPINNPPYQNANDIADHDAKFNKPCEID